MKSRREHSRFQILFFSGQDNNVYRLFSTTLTSLDCCPGKDCGRILSIIYDRIVIYCMHCEDVLKRNPDIFQDYTASSKTSLYMKSS